MIVIDARNVHAAMPLAAQVLQTVGVRCESRNGDVIRSPEPVTTVYRSPKERVEFWSWRDSNPFFHLYESLWMLGGRNDVESVAHYAANMRNFSDDGRTFHGAYGHRWRVWFERDQLHEIAAALRKNRDCRRQVLQMWDARSDLGREGRDVPCNLVAHFQVSPHGDLDLTVFNRSNDVVWGCYGANAVHFSVLLEYMAAAAGLQVGRYWQVSDNWHAYEATIEKLLPCAGRTWDPYVAGEVSWFPLVNRSIAEWDTDLEMFLTEGASAQGYRDVFFRRVALPMMRVHAAYTSNAKPRAFDSARTEIRHVAAADWALAALQWIDRREKRWLEKQQ